MGRGGVVTIVVAVIQTIGVECVQKNVGAYWARNRLVGPIRGGGEVMGGLHEGLPTGQVARETASWAGVAIVAGNVCAA